MQDEKKTEEAIAASAKLHNSIKEKLIPEEEDVAKEEDKAQADEEKEVRNEEDLKTAQVEKAKEDKEHEEELKLAHKPFTKEEVSKVKMYEEQMASEKDKKGFGKEQYELLEAGEAPNNVRYWAARWLEKYEQLSRKQERMDNMPVTQKELHDFKAEMIQVLQIMNRSMNAHIKIFNAQQKAMLDKVVDANSLSYVKQNLVALIEEAFLRDELSESNLEIDAYMSDFESLLNSMLLTADDCKKAGQEINLEDTKSPCEACNKGTKYSGACGPIDTTEVDENDDNGGEYGVKKVYFVPDKFDLIDDEEFKHIVLECEHWQQKPEPEPVVDDKELVNPRHPEYSKSDSERISEDKEGDMSVDKPKKVNL